MPGHHSLPEIERVLKEKETAAGKTRDEATMLLSKKSLSSRLGLPLIPIFDQVGNC